MTQKRRALALISGGLDSLLAAKVILDQGVAVEGLNFYTGFCHSGHTSSIRQREGDKPKRNDALWVAEQLGIPLHIIDVVEDYQQVLINPKYGYGRNLNPCLDCKVFMVKKAQAYLDEHGFDFIITGEVIGQRPKSQRKMMMPVIAKQSGANDRLLRPLSAKLLPPTLPEREGWVDREQLFDFSGRGRKPQIALAKSNSLADYAQPAGGCCVLTDKSYSHKLQDMWAHRQAKNYDLNDIILLKVGRHLRPSDSFKLIMGREAGENQFLEGYRKRFIHLRIQDFEGPLTLIEGEVTDADLQLCAQIAARFSAGRTAEQVRVKLINLAGEESLLTVKPLAPEAIEQTWYI